MYQFRTNFAVNFLHQNFFQLCSQFHDLSWYPFNSIGWHIVITVNPIKPLSYFKITSKCSLLQYKLITNSFCNRTAVQHSTICQQRSFQRCTAMLYVGCYRATEEGTSRFSDSGHKVLILLYLYLWCNSPAVKTAHYISKQKAYSTVRRPSTQLAYCQTFSLGFSIFLFHEQSLQRYIPLKEIRWWLTLLDWFNDYKNTYTS